MSRAVSEPDLFRGYTGDPQREPYQQAVDERIAELWRWRQWYRQHAYTIDWPVRWQNEHELRSLVRLARSARKAAAAAPDPIDLAAAAHDRHIAAGQADPDCHACERTWESWNMAGSR